MSPKMFLTVEYSQKIRVTIRHYFESIWYIHCMGNRGILETHCYMSDHNLLHGL